MTESTKRSSVVIFAAAMVLAGCDPPTVPQRSSPYAFRLSGSDSVFHWPATRLPVRYYAEPVGALREYTALGIDLWEAQFVYGEYTGTLVDDSADADVIISLSGGVPPDAPLTDDPPVTTCTGVTTVPGLVTDGAFARLGDILRVSVRWFPNIDASAIANCLARVTAHEIGHTLGIFAVDHAGTETTDLMFSPPSVRRPSVRDRWTVEILYHSRADILPHPRGRP